MKSKLSLAVLLLLTLILTREGRVQAAGLDPQSPLPPDNKTRVMSPQGLAWFAFEYGGDKSTIFINLSADAVPDIEFELYTPEQMDAWRHGQDPKPIGQLARQGGAPAPDLTWVGGFNRGGTFYILVHNNTSTYIAYRMAVSGRGIGYAEDVESDDDPASPQTDINTAPAATAPQPPPAIPLPMSPDLIASTVSIFLPAHVGMPPTLVNLAARPARCTPPSQMPASVTSSVALCPEQTYAPFRVTGSNLTVYGDPTAVIAAPGRTFGITVTGSNVTIFGVRIQAAIHPGDAGKWLCMYELCSYSSIYQHETVHGGIAYGGGVLLQNTANSAVVSSSVWGGTVGVASVGGAGNKIFNNNLSNLNGWGILLRLTNGDMVVANTMNDDNRACVGPDGIYYQSGCESAAISCVACQASVIVSNHCERAGNCYYATGEGGMSSNYNKYFDNYCGGATYNCFEVTFSVGNQFDYNVATTDQYTQKACTYPFWISGSVVYFGKHNTWACAHSINQAIRDSENATGAATEVRQL